MEDFDVQWHSWIQFQKDYARECPHLAFWGLVNSYRYKDKYWIVELVNHLLGGIMAKGNSKVSKNDTVTGGSWTKFVDVSLAGVAEEDLDRAYSNSDQLYDALASLVSGGYRVGLSFNPATVSFIASATCKDDGSPNFGCTLSAHAGDWVSSLRVLLYKHYVIANGDWQSGSSTGSRPKYG